MKIGLFDHIEHGERPTAQLFDERLTFIQAADEAGFYCLHLAEHHQTPLNMVPVPGVFLGAVARLTKRIKMGPLVYLLPLYSPLRMIDEICMLDHLSHGRAEIGVGRGVSPFELKYHKIEHDQSRDIFIDAYKCVSAGMGVETLTYKGPHYQFENVPIALQPLQKPHPPFWYGSSGARARPGRASTACISSRSGRTNCQGQYRHVQGGVRRARQQAGAAQGRVSRRHRDRRAAPHLCRRNRRQGEGLGQARNGQSPEQHQLVAEQARCYRHRDPHEERARHDLRGMRRRRHRDRGLARTVLAEIEKQHAQIGFNYLLTYLFLGTMSPATPCARWGCSRPRCAEAGADVKRRVGRPPIRPAL